MMFVDHFSRNTLFKRKIEEASGNHANTKKGDAPGNVSFIHVLSPGILYYKGNTCKPGMYKSHVASSEMFIIE